MTDPSEVDERPGDTTDEEYTRRLIAISDKPWKKLLHVQAPYQWDLRRLKLGRCLEVGCGIGRNLVSLPGGVGVDHNEYSVAECRRRGFEAYTVEEFFGRVDLTRPGSYDSLLASHLVEHVPRADLDDILGMYTPLVKKGGRFVFITPQEKGHASDPTHLGFTDFDVLADVALAHGAVPIRQYSYPFPRWAGTLFVYNEFHLVARKG
ncbi:class I SAM-dependent methyltransferase [Nigerium massiliense]|uniref:class I SAM-dependent methyltransferase n=1 Tax=Nigerium massiliense TaxID=1522317 RepID=UPI00058C7B74|nr:class I SAM-dependent methyltransferase [Nigerium massiliense]